MRGCDDHGRTARARLAEVNDDDDQKRGRPKTRIAEMAARDRHKQLAQLRALKLERPAGADMVKDRGGTSKTDYPTDGAI